MRKWLSSILLFIFLSASLPTHAENSLESGSISDWYDEYERAFGNITSIAQSLENDDRYTAGVSYYPAFSLETEEYLLRVIEIWSDGNEIFANVELSLNSECGIIRPYEWSLTNSRYYTPLNQYEVPVYFFFVEFGTAADKVSASSAWGINSLNQTMNRIQRCAIKRDVFPETNVNAVHFRVYIDCQENGMSSHETICFVIDCPNTICEISEPTYVP